MTPQIDTQAEIIMLGPEQIQRHVEIAVDREVQTIRHEMAQLQMIGACIVILLMLAVAWLHWRARPSTLARMEARQERHYALERTDQDTTRAAQMELIAELREHTWEAADKLALFSASIDRIDARVQRLEAVQDVPLA